MRGRGQGLEGAPIAGGSLCPQNSFLLPQGLRLTFISFPIPILCPVTLSGSPQPQPHPLGCSGRLVMKPWVHCNPAACSSQLRPAPLLHTLPAAHLPCPRQAAWGWEVPLLVESQGCFSSRKLVGRRSKNLYSLQYLGAGTAEIHRASFFSFPS